MATATGNKSDLRLEGLRRGLSSREAQREKLIEKIAATEQLEERAVNDSLSRAPKTRAYRQGEPAKTLQNDLRIMHGDLGDLNSEIGALKPLVQEESRAERERELGKLRAKLHELGNRELQVWESAAEIVDEVIASWNAYREILEERSAIYQEAIHSGVLAAGENEAYRELQDLVQGQIRPANGTIMSFVARILDVTLDPDGLGYRDPGGRPSDGNRRLPELLPDKRSQLRKLNVGGGVFELR